MKYRVGSLDLLCKITAEDCLQKVKSSITHQSDVERQASVDDFAHRFNQVNIGEIPVYPLLLRQFFLDVQLGYSVRADGTSARTASRHHQSDDTSRSLLLPLSQLQRDDGDSRRSARWDARATTEADVGGFG